MKGHKERRTGKIRGAFQGCTRPWTAGCGWLARRRIFLISVRERMLKIRARSSRDGQVESDLVPTAGGIRPDGTVGKSSPSREWIMGKSFDAGGEGSGLEEERAL